MKKHFILILAVISSLIAINYSCKKDNDSTDDYTTISEDNSISEGLFSDVFNQSDEAIKTTENDKLFDKGILTDSIYCSTITVSPIDIDSFPKTITLDFGETNCLCSDLKLRRGKILINITDRYKNANSIRTITFENYHVNDYKIEGIKTVTNNGYASDSTMSFSINVTGGKITKPDGGIIQREATRTRVWTEGINTLSISDDEYKITGTTTTTTSLGTEITSTIINPLDIKLSCKWITGGSIEIKRENRPDIIFDYGDGECDNKATITRRNKTFDITLRQ